MKRERDKAIWRLASRQQGAFSRIQALAAGFSSTEIRLRLANGTWLRLGRGVYAIAGTVDSWERWAWVRVLEAGDGAALSHDAAGYKHALIDDPPRLIDVTAPVERKRKGTH